MNIPFYKYQGTGNDFVVIDNRKKNYALTNEQVSRLCNRRFGIGADGLMLLNDVEGYDFRMVYYNADGKEGSMCGNGGRCLVQFAFDLGIKKKEYHFIAVDGPHYASFSSKGWVKLKMKDVSIAETGDDYAVLDTGSPHYVKLVPEVMSFPVFDSGRAIRNNDQFRGNGINVNFVEQRNDHILVRTYERGVEDETLSCGTGVTASALVTGPKQTGFNLVNVTTPGGNLAVEFERVNDRQFKNIWLCGPATFVFKGKIEV
ncbi:diaminopimelate epimerase [Segetibacter sp. 3557_3]|uniref:diaminopimelate epimerase n=1 Tax=Segetibacter sp. 3557_3 TaxID=2547429 RepID=UPI001058ACB2|nr:diaminopimelate epimerase [Segetibacter sp. 3557_3]TDH21596.1 diaminopimelate epimerase [Segetibacter sp. 3557_3]